MYEQFFHLKKRPFSIAPDPGFLYMSDRHRDALAHLKYGLESDGGFVLVTGEVGTGKTTLLRNIIGKVPGDIDVAFILNPRLTVRELLQTICDELAIEYPTEDQHSVKPYIDRLNKHLLTTHQKGRSTVVVIDEAQNLSPAVLEQLRLLTNLETNERKLLRIILVGQPELKAMLDRQELRQLSQRITARYHLQPLNLADTRAYLSHRLSVSGGNPNLFSRGASWNIHRHAGGIPRLINIIADRAMLGAYADSKPRIDFMTSQKAASETLSDNKALWNWLAVAGAVLLAAGASWWLLKGSSGSVTPPQVTQSAKPESPTESSLPPDYAPQQNQPQAQLQTQENTQSRPTYDETLTEIVVRNPDSQSQSQSQSQGNRLRTANSPPNIEQQTPIIEAPVLTTTIDANIPAPKQVAAIDASPRNAAPRPTSGLSVTPAGVPSYRSQRLAFETMYQLWGISYDASEAIVPCDYAPRYQLQCTKRKGDWTMVQRLNVPVVMQFADDDGKIFYATAVSARDGRVSLDQGGRRSVVKLDALKQSWTGIIIALWPTPKNYRGSIKDGSNGTAVRELRELLSGAINRDLGSSRTFDSQLSQALQEFQSANGMLQDGIAGPATWLLLHRAAGYDIPELQG